MTNLCFSTSRTPSEIESTLKKIEFPPRGFLVFTLHWFPPLAFCHGSGSVFAGVQVSCGCAFDSLGVTTGNNVSINNLFIVYFIARLCRHHLCVYTHY